MSESRDIDEADDDGYAPRDFDAATSSLMGMAAAAVQVWEPTLGVMAAGAAPFLSALAARWRERAIRGAGVVVQEALTSSGLTAEQLLDALSDDERVQLAINVMRAAPETSYEPALRMLGRALAAAADDDARLDTEEMVVRAVLQLQDPHVEVLNILVMGSSGKEPRTEEGRFAASQSHIWNLQVLAAAAPGLADGLEPILALLQREGLIQDVPPQTYDDQAAGLRLVAATTFGREIIRRAIEVGEQRDE